MEIEISNEINYFTPTPNPSPHPRVFAEPSNNKGTTPALRSK
jgi:hypothetical protein